VWPEHGRFVRRLSYDGATVWTHGINAHRINADCGTFIGIGEIVPDDPDQRRGAYLARFDANGSELWRWTQEGDGDTTVGFSDVDVRGDLAYLIREEFTGGAPSVVRLLALANVPKAPACASTDTVAPTATAARWRLVTGTAISSGRTTVRLVWTGSDATSGISRYELAQSTDGGAWTTVATALTSPTIDRLLAYGHTYRFRVRAIDQAGNVGAWAYGSTFRLTAVSQSSSSVRYRGTWVTSTSTTVWWGGTARSSSTRGSTASFTFTGRSIAWVGLKAANRGKAYVYINGVLKATVDLYSAATLKQRVVWSTTYSTSAARTIMIKVLGTTGRPRVDVDGFLVGS
jgi:hypothetical protein